MPNEAYEFDPISDPRWGVFLARHPKASVFHSVPWLATLQTTYEYHPVAFTTSPPSTPLQNALVFCVVDSWLTGRRLVSLPFSDHCEPLCDSGEELEFLARYLQATLARRGCKYIEVRPVTSAFGQVRNGFSPTGQYYLHRLDLRADADVLFRSFDKDSVQRRIQRAGRAGLIEKSGASEELLDDFYSLFVITRRRHGLPPIPRPWFSNLHQNHADSLRVRVAYKDTKPIAAILTLQFRDIVYYKYGCSDHTFNNLGGMPWLFWNAILAAKSNGASQLDLGRTDHGQAGLLAFKNHWAFPPRDLTYWSFPVNSALGATSGWKMRAAKRLFTSAPESVLKITGRLLYRHIG
jgi:Acetyltransferase (GNAT) domain